MNQYQYHVARIMEYLAERKQCTSSRASHQKCYEEFGAFQSANDLMFTEETAEQWILSIIKTHTRQQCYFWRKYLHQLQAFIELGSIPDDLFYQIQPSYDKVPTMWKDSLDQYLESVKDHYTKRSFEISMSTAKATRSGS